MCLCVKFTGLCVCVPVCVRVHMYCWVCVVFCAGIFASLCLCAYKCLCSSTSVCMCAYLFCIFVCVCIHVHVFTNWSLGAYGCDRWPANHGSQLSPFLTGMSTSLNASPSFCPLLPKIPTQDVFQRYRLIDFVFISSILRSLSCFHFCGKRLAKQRCNLDPTIKFVIKDSHFGVFFFRYER